MENLETSSDLVYRDSDGVPRKVERCRLTQDKFGRHWLWSEQLEQSLAYRIKGREDCLLAAISSLLFILSLKDKRIAELQKIADLAQRFAAEVMSDEEQG